MEVNYIPPKGRQPAQYEAVVDEETRVIYTIRPDDEHFFALKFKCAGKWYYQFLMWSCRGGKSKYYRAMVALYRYLRRNGIINHSLRYLARGENWYRNRGQIIRAGMKAQNREEARRYVFN